MLTICRPKRKRAFRRALKRGEQWAVYQDAMNNVVRAMAQRMYGDVLEPNPFLRMVGLQELLNEES